MLTYFLLLLLLVVIVIIWWNWSGGCISRCAYSHSQEGENYPWLSDYRGGVDHILFREAGVNNGQWQLYNEHWWEVHCKVISHNPKDLVEAHRKAFLVNNSPIKLKFFFKDGTSEILNESHIWMYRREADYFKRHNICS